jgi:Glutaredoxin-like domain (DUF836)
MVDTPLPELILYGRADCALCAEARELVTALLADRQRRGLPTPALVERDIDSNADWHRRFFATIPVVELGDQRLETTIGLGALRRLLSDVFDAQPASA